jgi:outer membrane biosynthesis protein TonB
MRTAVAISAAGHSALLLWGLVSFAVKPLDAAPAESMPVDLVSITDFTQMMAGAQNAPKSPAPKRVAEKVAEAKPAEDITAKIDKREVQAAREPAPAEPKPPEQKPPDPKPAAATPPAPKAEAKDKKPPDQKPDPIAEALKKEESKKPTPKPEPPKPAPQAKPAPPQPKFDPSRVAALLDKRDPTRLAAAGEAVNTTPTLGARTGSASQLTQSEIDALRAQIQQCWNPPAGATDGKDLVVQIRLQLNQDGSLTADPTLVNRGNHAFFRVAAESALRAIRRCQPYKLPIAKYDIWRDVEVTFDPREMFRG